MSDVELQRLREERDKFDDEAERLGERAAAAEIAWKAAEAELQRLRGGISVRDALVTENAIRAAAAEAEVQRLREGLDRLADAAEVFVPDERYVDEQGDDLERAVIEARALLADSPDGSGA